MTWMRTHREWGNGRTLRGNAHFMLTGDAAVCGYRPHARTRMRTFDLYRAKLSMHNPQAVQLCPKCVAIVERRQGP